MRKQMAKILIAVLLLGTLTDVSTAKAATPKLNKSKLTLYIGSNYTLKVKKASGKVKWTSGKKSVATVSSKGKVVAKKQERLKSQQKSAALQTDWLPLYQFYRRPSADRRSSFYNML